jgi:tRNA dimethylallyltransferase
MTGSDENRPIIPILTGPTGAGKTGVALKLLEIRPNIHIISADSRQIYKYLNIGTDKPPAKILEKYNFHLVDFVEPGERCTAFDFVEDTEKLLANLLASGSLPLICGGTGLYIKSLVEGIFEIDHDDLSIRKNLEDEAIEKGPKFLYEKLKEIDSLEARKTHPHNLKRIIRALEIYYITGKPKSKIIASSSRPKDGFRYRIFCLMPPRDEIYRKIDERVDQMKQRGLIREVQSLYNLGLKEKVEKINVIGYSEMIKHLDGKITEESAVNLIKQNSRRFAKRQITWFRGMKNIEYVDSAEAAISVLKGFWSFSQK